MDQPPSASVPLKAPATPPGSVDREMLRARISDAMIQGGHETAGSLFEAGTWEWDGSELRIRVAASKTLLELVYTSQAQQIVRDMFRKLTDSGRAVKVEPGEASAAAKKNQAPTKQVPRNPDTSGERPQDHPIIRHAQELFKAEVRSVVSLRDPQ